MLSTKLLLSVTTAGALLAACATSQTPAGQVQPPAADGKFQTEYFTQFPATPEAVTRICDAAVAGVRAGLDFIAARPAADVTFDNTVVMLDHLLSELDESLATVYLTQLIGAAETPQKLKALHDAANACDVKVKKFSAEQLAREDLYAAFKPFTEKDQAGKRQRPDIPAGGETEILLKKIEREFRLNGLFLPREQRAQHIADQVAITRLANDFRTRTQDTQYVVIKDAWTEGMDATYKARLMVDTKKTLQQLAKQADRHKHLLGAKLLLPLIRGPYREFMTNTPSEEARREVYLAWWKRGGEANIETLEHVLKLRQGVAARLGYKSYAHLATEDKMSGDPKVVADFLDRFGKGIQPKLEQELSQMRALKCGRKKNCAIEAHDWRYWSGKLKESRYKVDEARLKGYLPTERVVEEVFGLCQRMFGVKFVSQKLPIPAWADADKLGFYKVVEADSERTLGYFYTDLYLREGKYPGAFQLTMRRNRAMPFGQPRLPVAFVDAALDPPMVGRKATVAFEQASLFFHEFGHAIHALLGRSRYGLLAGTSVKRDFVEAPSQMMENWVWQPEVLKKINPEIPDELIAAKLKARFADAGLFWSRQLLFAKADLVFHAPWLQEQYRDKPGPGWTTAAYNKVHDQVRGFKAPAGTRGQAAFNHILGGYATGYYGYLWSMVIAADMFSRFESEGVFNTRTGASYVNQILAPGATRDPNESVKAFLGRPWNMEAFMQGFQVKAGVAPR